MKTATLPAYEPKAQPEPFCGYDKSVKAYGKPPTGYRWLKVGEKVPANAIFADHHFKVWCKTSHGETVRDAHYALAAPIIPELIPDDPSAAVVLEVVSRNSKAVRFKIARQSDAAKNGELFKASNKLQIESIWEPQILFSRGYPHGKFYLRGENERNDDSILSCTPKRFEQIVAALTEYNASLAPKPAPQEHPKCAGWPPIAPADVAPAPVSSEPPKYTGRCISAADSLASGIDKAGPAPYGWRYLDTDEVIKADDWLLHHDQWKMANHLFKHMVGFPLTVGFWPVIRRVEPCSPPKSPESIVAELQSEIAALKAKVAEQEKSLAKIKAIVA